MPLYRYLCPQGHETEQLRPMDAVSAPCSCGAEAARQAVNRVAVVGYATVPRDERNYRKEYAEYREASAEVADFYNTKRANGDPVTEPDYLGIAKRGLQSHGVPIN